MPSMSLCHLMGMQTISIICTGTWGLIAAADKISTTGTRTITDIINFIFHGSVEALIVLARLLGMTYQEINVWFFCVAWPLLTLLLMYAVFLLVRQNRELRRESHV